MLQQVCCPLIFLIFSQALSTGRLSTGAALIGLQSHRMDARVVHGLFFLAILLSAAKAENAPVLKSYGQPVYPPIAKLAGLEGSVTVEFVLDQQGKVVKASALQDSTMLAKAAESFVKTWQFQSGSAASYRTTIHFKLLHGVADPRVTTSVSVRNDSFRSFEVTALVGDTELSKCPTGEDANAPAGTTPADFVALSRSLCYGPCPSYSVRVYADGKVVWDGSRYVLAQGHRTGRIDASAARGLIERFRTKEFWSLCGAYTRMVTDNPTVTVVVTLAGRTRVVSDYAESAPLAEQERELAIDEISNSHFWRHGDPASEPITRIYDDTYLPKPGVTPLIRAASGNDVLELIKLLATGKNANETDASGWSALMYAAASGHSIPVQLLLHAGANPNQVSIGGDTPLIASASQRAWDADLVRSGAKVNWQNREGQTALMFLAAQAKVDELRDALKAGASATLKDREGRTAVDYLRQASCGKSPISDPLTTGWMTTTYSTCNALNEDDVRACNKLLSEAVAKTGRRY
jgi:TonB family protein